jgi:glycosyltransferase involved in cell wall biosynthesis
MRIAIVASPFVPVPPQKYGGTERVIYYLVKGLVEQGHTVTLLAPGDSQVDCELIPICDKAIPFARTKELDEELAPARNAANQKAKDELRKIMDRIDIIHSHGVDLSDFKDFPNVTTLHGPINLKNIEYYQDREHLYYISISNNQQETYPNLNYVGTVYNGLDPLPFVINETPQDYLTFIGRFDREKNPHLAIQLAMRLNMPIKLAGKIDLGGNDYFEEEVRPLIENNPLVEFVGEVDTQQKAELLRNAKCNLHPTGFREPFGLTVLEAAYCGTPTLAIERGSMPELIEEGRTGMLVEDFDEGFHAIQKCFEMDRNYIAQRSRLLFNYNVMARQYVLAYEKTIQLFNERKGGEVNVPNFLGEANRIISQLWQRATSPDQKDPENKEKEKENQE